VRAFERDIADTTSNARPSATVVPGMITALSDRELEVLRLLAEGRQNRLFALR